MRLPLLAALLLLASQACAMGRRPPRPTSIAQIEEREKVADQKRRENDSSAADEYRAAIGQAEAAAAAAAAPLRDALLLLEAGPRGPGALEWRRSALEILVQLTLAERAELKEKVGELTGSQREGTLRWLASSGPRDSLLYQLPGSLRDWRTLREALGRMRAHCGEDCR